MRDQLRFYSQRQLSNMLMIGVSTPVETVLASISHFGTMLIIIDNYY